MVPKEGAAALLEQQVLTLRKTGRTAEAVDILRDRIATAPEDMASRMALADCHRALGDLDAADTVYADVIASVPGHRQAMLGRIDIEAERGDLAAAIRRCEAVIDGQPQEASFQTKHAALLQKTGQHSLAIGILEGLRDRKPDSVPLLLQLGRTRLANGETEPADGIFEKILQMDPSHARALAGRVECAVRDTDYARARIRVDAALSQTPDDKTLLLKRSAILDHLGQHAERLAFLGDLNERFANQDAIAIEYGTALRMSGDHSAAEAVFAGVVHRMPQNLRAWDGRIKAAISGGNLKGALHMCDEALSHLPGHATLILQQAMALRLSGRADEAAAVLKDRLAAAPADVASRMALGACQRALGDFDAADAIYSDILGQTPQHRGALFGRIDTAVDRGDLGLAIALCQTAITEQPDDPQFRVRCAGLLQKLGRVAEAIDIFEGLLQQKPGSLSLRLQLGQARLAAGYKYEADRLFAQILEINPGHSGALAGRLDVAEAHGDPRRALALLDRAQGRATGPQDAAMRAGTDRPGNAIDDPRLLLKRLELLLKIGDTATLKDLLQELEPVLSDFAEPELIRLFRISDRAGSNDFLANLLDVAFGRETLSLRLASLIMERAHSLGDDDLSDRVARQLREKLSPSCKLEFDVLTTAMAEGPEAAVNLVRKNLSDLPPTKAPLLLGRWLVIAGRADLSFRYLRRGFDRWQDLAGFRPYFISACIRSGHPERAEQLFRDLGAANPGIDLNHLRLGFLSQTGRMEEALELALHRDSAGSGLASPDLLMRLLLALDKHDEAQAHVPRMTADMGYQSSAKFSVTHFGSMLNEARIYSLSATGATGGDEASLAQAFFVPARRIVDRWCEEPVARVPASVAPEAPEIPKRIFQYWDQPELPDEIKAISASWQGHPGFDYLRFDRREALAFLDQRMGRDYVRAFRLANHVAEGADFLRLCVLYDRGGVYADMDDRLISRRPERLFEGVRGALLHREPFRAIVNSLICVAPQSPLIRIAMDAARTSLLSRENDNTWLKTGPGLMTRAAATFITQVGEDEARRSLHIRPQYELFPFVQTGVKFSYKSKATYWNARGGLVQKVLLERLDQATKVA